MLIELKNLLRSREVLLLLAPLLAVEHTCVGDAVYDFVESARQGIGEELTKRIVAAMEEGALKIGKTIIWFPPVRHHYVSAFKEGFVKKLGVENRNKASFSSLFFFLSSSLSFLLKRRALPARFKFSFLGIGTGMRLCFNPPAPGGPFSSFYVFLKNHPADSSSEVEHRRRGLYVSCCVRRRFVLGVGRLSEMQRFYTPSNIGVMSKQYLNKTLNVPPITIVGSVYANGRWGGVDEVVSDIVELYNMWRDARPPSDEKTHTWFCPICTTTRYYPGRRKIPECPRHFGMRRYDEEEFTRRRKELAEAALRDIPRVIPVFAKAVEMYSGKPPVEWRFENGVVVVKPDDPTELRYEEGAIRAVFYRCDLENYCNAAQYIKNEAVALGLKTALEFYPPHFYPPKPFPAHYDRKKNMYVYKL
jgi:hypothetical protein